MSEENLSAAERMAQFQRHMKIEESGLTSYWTSLPFSPDPFQVEALEAVALGESVLVCAPTGSGKTVLVKGRRTSPSGGVNEPFTQPPSKPCPTRNSEIFRRNSVKTKSVYSPATLQ